MNPPFTKVLILTRRVSLILTRRVSLILIMMSFACLASAQNSAKKKALKGAQNHTQRVGFKSRHPLHITLRLMKGLPNLRRKKYFKIFQKAALKARGKNLSIVHFSVQSNHLHLLIESRDKLTLALGMQSFCTSFAKRLNSLLSRKGQVFKERYFIHILKTPSEVKKALVYVFQNWAKHTNRLWRFDPFSTLLCFTDKVKLGLSKVNTHSIFQTKQIRGQFKTQISNLIVEPQSWLLTQGWKRALG